jgi:hypothetical protein
MSLNIKRLFEYYPYCITGCVLGPGRALVAVP